MIQVAFNVLAISFLGWLFRKLKLIGEKGEYALNHYLFYLALPSIVMFEMVNLPLDAIGFPFVLLNSLPLIVLMILVFIAFKLDFLKEDFAKVLFIVPALGNTVYLGFPVMSMRFGASSLSYAALLSSIQDIVIFTVGLFFINLISEEKKDFGRVKKLLLRNPLLWATFTGLIFAFLKIKLPGAILNLLGEISKTTLPVALFALGASLCGRKLRGNLKKVSVALFLKFFLLPLICAAFIKIFSFDGEAVKITFMEYAMPPAVMNFIIARNFGFNKELTSQVIIIGTLLFAPIVFLFDYILKVLF